MSHSPQDEESDAGAGQVQPRLGVVIQRVRLGGHARWEVVDVTAVRLHWRQVNVLWKEGNDDRGGGY